MRYITFALAKGRLAKKAMEILEEIGITCEEMKDEKTRKLIFVNEELKLKLNNIEDFYQGRINRLIKRFEDEKSNEIQELKNEIKDLKSRALVNPKKITDKQVNEVKELRALGLSYRKIAERTSLGTTTICRIINGEYE